MNRIEAFATLAVTMGCLTLSAAPRPRQASVSTVVVTTDRESQPDFVSYESLSALVDGRPVPIVRIAPVDGPAAIMLLVDLTWSATRGVHPQLRIQFEQMRGERSHRMVGDVRPVQMFPGVITGLDKAFLPWLRAGDQLYVGSFAGQHLSFSRNAASNPNERLAAFKEAINPEAAPLDGWFGTAPVWDAVALATGRLTNSRAPRAIVLVTDGESSGNRVSLTDAIRTAVERGVAVHIVCAKSWWDPALYQAADTFIRPLADETGGLFRIDDRFDRLPWDRPAQIFGDLIAAVHRSVELQLDVTNVPTGVWPLVVRTSVREVTLHAPKWIVKQSTPANP